MISIPRNETKNKMGVSWKNRFQVELDLGDYRIRLIIRITKTNACDSRLKKQPIPHKTRCTHCTHKKQEQKTRNHLPYIWRTVYLLLGTLIRVALVHFGLIASLLVYQNDGAQNEHLSADAQERPKRCIFACVGCNDWKMVSLSILEQ